jgi:DNA-binding Lrp family transcriptional regulator
MNVERDMINAVADALTDIDGVSEVYSVAGRYDLVCIIRVSDNEKLADVVTEKIRKVEGILETETLIAFRAFSKHDLEGMFSVGME